MNPSVVDLPNSYAVLGRQTGGRDDSIYFRIVGAGSSGELCAPLEENILLAKVALPTAPTAGGAASLTSDQLTQVSSSLDFPQNTSANMDGEPVVDVNDAAQPASAYVLVSGPDTANIEVRVSPNVGDESGFEWLVRLAADREIARAVVGLRMPTGVVSASEVQVQGCNETDCLGGGVGPYVDPGLSRIVGLGSNPALPNDVVYLDFIGQETPEEIGSDQPTLNHVGETIPIAVVTISSPLATPFVPPIVTFEGAEIVSNPDPPLVNADDGLPQIDVLAALQATSDGQQSEDLDGDGIPTSDDNCPFLVNTDQTDRGGFKSTLRNQIGDACECGEVSGDGQIQGTAGSTDDVAEMQKILAGLAATPETEDRCSISGDPGCDILDVFILDQAIDTSDLNLLRRTCPTASPTNTGSGG
jgi:hypothetical protein